MNALHSFENSEYGLVASVHTHVHGYSVTLKDMDADDYVPSVIICKDEVTAIRKAKEMVG